MSKRTSNKQSGTLNPQADLPKLAAPAQRALASAGVQRLNDLTQFTEEEVSQWHGIGPNAMNQLRRSLEESSLAFAKKK